jgi:hypothetical protein
MASRTKKIIKTVVSPFTQIKNLAKSVKSKKKKGKK